MIEMRKAKLIIVLLALSFILTLNLMAKAEIDTWVTSEVDEDLFYAAYRFDDVDMVYLQGDDMRIVGWYMFDGPNVLRWGLPIEEAYLSIMTMGPGETDLDASMTLYGVPAKQGGALSIYDDMDQINGPYTANYVNVNLSSFVGAGVWHNITVTNIVREINQGYYFYDAHNVAFVTLSADDHDAERYASSEENGFAAKLYVHYKTPDVPPESPPELVFEKDYRNYTIWTLEPEGAENTTYRQIYNITGSVDGAQTDYQIKIILNYDDTAPPTSVTEQTGNPVADVPQAGWALTVLDAPAFLRISESLIYLFMEGFPPNGGPGETLGKLESSDEGVTWAWSSNSNPLADFANVGQAWSGHGDEACPAPVVASGTKYLFYASKPNAAGAYGDWSMGVATTLDWETFSPIDAINPILALGGGGTWDEECAFHTSKPILVNGTWYMFYTGRRNVDGLSQIGLATTSEGNFPDNWAKHGGNPFFVGSRPKIIFVDDVYYMYYIGADTTLKRRTSVDLINWTDEQSIDPDIIEADIISAGGDYILAGMATIWDGNSEIGIWRRGIGEMDLEGHSRTDFGDVRFMQNDTLIDYWIDGKVDGAYAEFWVEVPVIPADPDSTTIEIYYGNPSATTTSNGTATFPDLFENFEDGVVGNPPVGWTGDDGFFDVEDDYAYHGNKSLRGNPAGGVWKHLDKTISNTGKFVLEYVIRRDTISETQAIIVYDGVGQGTWLGFAKQGGVDGIYYNDGVNKLIASYEADRWYKIDQVMDTGADTYDIYVDDVLIVSDADFKAVSTTMDSFELWDFAAVNAWTDRILIRKHVDAEPEHQGSGFDEEEIKETCYVFDENGTLVWTGTNGCNETDIEDIIDEIIGYPDPEDPNPPGWEDTGFITIHRFKLVLFLIGMTLFVGTPVWGFATRPEAATWIIIMMSMLCGVALLWSLQLM